MTSILHADINGAHERASVGYQSLGEILILKKTACNDKTRYHIVPSKRKIISENEFDFSGNKISEIRKKREAKSFRSADYAWGHSERHSGYPFQKYPKPDIDTFTGTQVSNRPSIPWNPSGTRGNIGVARIGNNK